MSIVTGRGDEGETDLLFGKRIAKTDPRVEAIGAADELTAALGVARVLCPGTPVETSLDWMQDRLVALMGELAVLPEDAARYQQDGYPAVASEDVARAETAAREIEAGGVKLDGWARPGKAGSALAAQLDVARAICRRTERRVVDLGTGVTNASIPIFLNRLSDWLWLAARREES
ncbi:MAG: cob(I)yrinic acid a,c-diamide adenosyltransferase [Akkermansiaceae bacterium]|nr:cob(I)yrinic acid a,c-diamide adenosyltransferase [Akkermansiaceae bacterium]NNM30558.1 cob(I)yrinic acid a,c-diamide adenosyltransferase [Akkermansiaceae bacterium]